jgi:hypothetical protein
VLYVTEQATGAGLTLEFVEAKQVGAGEAGIL